jgi:hypothetical protein
VAVLVVVDGINHLYEQGPHAMGGEDVPPERLSLQHALQCLADVAKLSHFSVNSKAYKLVLAAGITTPHSCPVRCARGAPL